MNDCEVIVIGRKYSYGVDEQMHAALHINIPNYASAIVTTDEVVDSISSL
jgi:ureidoacrylate peracid hydrolase